MWITSLLIISVFYNVACNLVHFVATLTQHMCLVIKLTHWTALGEIPSHEYVIMEFFALNVIMEIDTFEE